jgi:hypothetical protein
MASANVPAEITTVSSTSSASMQAADDGSLKMIAINADVSITSMPKSPGQSVLIV